MAICLIFFALTVVFAKKIISESFQLYEDNDRDYCLNTMLILKYGMIPFVVLYTLITTLICLTVDFGVPGGSPYTSALTIAIVGAWLLLLPGAFYGIQVIRFSLWEREISQPAAIIHGIAQFLFVADVIDATYFASVKSRRNIRIALFLFVCALIAVYIYYLKLKAGPHF